jgi:hypothetical protein
MQHPTQDKHSLHYPYEENEKDLHELHPKPVASFIMLAPSSSCTTQEPAGLQYAMICLCCYITMLQLY